jgi:hypothetical protein
MKRLLFALALIGAGVRVGMAQPPDPRSTSPSSRAYGPLSGARSASHATAWHAPRSWGLIKVQAHRGIPCPPCPPRPLSQWPCDSMWTEDGKLDREELLAVAREFAAHAPPPPPPSHGGPMHDPCTMDPCTVDPCTVDLCTMDPCRVRRTTASTPKAPTVGKWKCPAGQATLRIAAGPDSVAREALKAPWPVPWGQAIDRCPLVALMASVGLAAASAAPAASVAPVALAGRKDLGAQAAQVSGDRQDAVTALPKSHLSTKVHSMACLITGELSTGNSMRPQNKWSIKPWRSIAMGMGSWIEASFWSWPGRSTNHRSITHQDMSFRRFIPIQECLEARKGIRRIGVAQKVRRGIDVGARDVRSEPRVHSCRLACTWPPYPAGFPGGAGYGRWS